MNGVKSKINRNASIAIVGAGPAGLSTAWFLSQNGFRNVTVLEKLGRVGGLCKSITVDGLSYDLGANYLTWAYQETLKIAKSVGATTYAEEPYTSLEIDSALTKYEFRTFRQAILFNAYTNKKVSLLEFLGAAIRYLRIRWKLSQIIDAPDYLEHIDNHKKLCVPFLSWLKTQNLMALSSLFQFPITIMGYGKLEDIATPYALRYMSLRTFFPMIFGSLCFVRWTIGSWPRRFTLGFQRLWERVSWSTNVRLNVNITHIERGEKITIQFEYPGQDLNEIKIFNDQKTYDYLILACPLTPDVLGRLGLTLSKDEETISQGISYNPYCMTTFWVNGIPKMKNPIAPILPIPERGIPWAVARQFQNTKERAMFTQFYTRPAEGQSDQDVIGKVKKLIDLVEGRIEEREPRWHTFDKFTYFQHFSAEQIEQGIYRLFAQMQGQNNTFYVGGATDFELVEPIVQHSKYLVEKHFAGISN